MCVLFFSFSIFFTYDNEHKEAEKRHIINLMMAVVVEATAAATAAPPPPIDVLLDVVALVVALEIAAVATKTTQL